MKRYSAYYKRVSSIFNT